MSEEYTPPEVWSPPASPGGKFANINRPTSGATQEKELPRGEHPFQLHSLATPNGVKVTLLLEELIEKGHPAQYDAYLVDILSGDQFGSGFVDINPNSKIPAMIHYRGQETIKLFESGSILLYLADYFQDFIPSTQDVAKRTETMNWLFWQMGSAPYLGGGFGHFYNYAPVKIKYCIDRFAMEVKRQLDVLDKALANRTYIAGEDYTIADIAIWPWYGGLIVNNSYDAGKFLDVESYKHVKRWAESIQERPAAKRGVVVNRTWGNEGENLPERHSSEDFKKMGL